MDRESLDYNALQLLVEAEGKALDLPLQAVAEHLDVNAQAAARVLERLVDDGLIDARFNRGDDQVLGAHVLRVTAEGHRISEDVSSVSKVNQRNRAPRIFLSHARHDRSLADALVELLRLGTDLSRQQIFYTSGTGTGVPAGKNFIDHIRDELQDTSLTVQIITPAFLDSAFCMCECGAVWISSTESFPIIVPPVTYADLRGILGNIQVERLDDAGTALDLLHDRIRTFLGLNPDTAAWNAARATFLRRLPSLLTTVAGYGRRPNTATTEMSSAPRTSARRSVLGRLAEMHDEQTQTSQVLELDLDELARTSGVGIGLIRQELARLLTEGLIEGFAETMAKGATDGACRITGEGLRALNATREATNRLAQRRVQRGAADVVIPK